MHKNFHYEYVLCNVSNHATIWLVGKIVYNHLQEKKDETCSKEQVITVQDSLQ